MAIDMKITALVENKTCGGITASKSIKSVHGLALYIETPKHRMLFDAGPDKTLFENSETLGIDLTGVDIAVISHGHYDHGGALGKLLEINDKVKVYAQRKAFDKHYSKRLFKKAGIGLEDGLQAHPQVVLLDGDYVIDDELTLFTTPDTEKYYSDANKTLYTDSGKDDFAHEQNLIISGDTTVLILGCGHAGVVNILEKASANKPQVCVGGYHLWNPVTKKTVPDVLLEGIAKEMAKYDMRYYTCHCTGQKAYEDLAGKLPYMKYLSCGETIEI